MSDKSKMFVGVEAEGRYKGLRTLFIPAFGLASNPSIYDVTAIAKDKSCSHIYFGASSDYCLFKDLTPQQVDVLLFMAKGGELLLTFETVPEWVYQIPTALMGLGNVRIMLTIDVPHAAELGRPCFEIKVQDYLSAHVFNDPKSIDLSYVRDETID